MNSIDRQKFKNSLANWAAGVSVVTARTDHAVHGMTVNAFSSVSLDPPLILVCISQATRIHQMMHDSGGFAVNILAEDQAEWGKLFAGFYPEIEDRFNGIDVITAATGAPVLPGVLAWLDCEVHQTTTAGDHTIFLGRVRACDSVEAQAPLIYTQRAWGSFAPAPKASKRG